MYNNSSPAYLSSLIPPPPATAYNLRHSDRVQSIKCRTTLYSESFLPSTIRKWNQLDESTRNSSSIGEFKTTLRQNSHVRIPKYFYYGNRRLQILHLRLRTGCSSLKDDLFRKHIVDNPTCLCGVIETVRHYLCECPLYHGFRQDMFNMISPICNPSLNTLLWGNDMVDNASNERIIDAVHTFIRRSGRFQ